jgi:hypothetical protein
MKHILFPVDFSDQCKAMKPFVKSMAARFGADVTLIHVLQIPMGFYTGFDVAYPMALDLEAMKADANEHLAAFFDVAYEPASGGVHFVTDVGDAARVIVDYAEDHEIDLIMAPTHGRGGFRGLLLGSTTAKILHDAKCPVMTTAHVDDPHLAEHAQCKTILCASDFSEESASLLQRAAEFAATLGAGLEVVHAVAGAQTQVNVVPDYDFQHFLLQAAREQAARLQDEAGTNLPICVEGGEVSKVVRAAAIERQADLVIIGHGKLHQPFGRLRTHSYSIVRDSPCPVLSL